MSIVEDTGITIAIWKSWGRETQAGNLHGVKVASGSTQGDSVGSQSWSPGTPLLLCRLQLCDVVAGQADLLSSDLVCTLLQQRVTC